MGKKNEKIEEKKLSTPSRMDISDQSELYDMIVHAYTRSLSQQFSTTKKRSMVSGRMFGEKTLIIGHSESFVPKKLVQQGFYTYHRSHATNMKNRRENDFPILSAS